MTSDSIRDWIESLIKRHATTIVFVRFIIVQQRCEGTVECDGRFVLCCTVVLGVAGRYICDCLIIIYLFYFFLLVRLNFCDVMRAELSQFPRKGYFVDRESNAAPKASVYLSGRLSQLSGELASFLEARTIFILIVVMKPFFFVPLCLFVAAFSSWPSATDGKRLLGASDNEASSSSASSHLRFLGGGGDGKRILMARMGMMGKTLEEYLDAMVGYGQITATQKASVLSLVGNLDNSVEYDPKRNNGLTRTFDKQQLRGYIRSQQERGLLSEDAANYLWNLLQLQQNGGGSSAVRVPARTGYAGGGGVYPGTNGPYGVVKLVGEVAVPADVYRDLTYNGITGWYDAANDREYALQCSPGQLHIIDVTDCRASAQCFPSLVRTIAMNGGQYWRDVDTHGDYAYVAAQGNRKGKPPPLYVVNLPRVLAGIVDGTSVKVVPGYEDLGHTLNVANGILCLNYAGASEGM